MSADCQKVQELLVESKGRIEALPGEAARHVAQCPGCTRVAEAERMLAAAFAAAMPPEDEALTERILETLRERRRRERILRLLPLAASVFLVLGAVALLGGIPGAGLIAAVPGTAASGGLGLAGTLMAWVRSVMLAADTLSAVVPWWLAMLSLLAAAGGLLAGRRLLRRIGARTR